MGSYSEETEEEERFFDSREISSVSDSDSTCYDDCSSSVEFEYNFAQYEVWFKTLESVHDRRMRFLKWMGLSSDQNKIAQEESAVQSLTEIQLGIDRMVDSSGAVLRTSGFECSYVVSVSIVFSLNETRDSFENVTVEDTTLCKIRNLDDGTEFIVDELDQNGMLSRLRATRGSSFEARDYESTVGSKMQRVKVHSCKKRCKELSSLYAGQEFLAHNGSILTMKFSHDGQYLASGGEDGVVRVWRVIEDDRLDQFHLPSDDPSFLYFSMNHLSKIASLDVDTMKVDTRKRHISSDSTCVIFPPKAFKVLEKPLHDFQGHNGEVLDLSWSKKRFLLSSSVDQTIRLWQVGHDRCLRIFSHNNYVTCVDFNPVDDNYFISGSIDGKIRIWEVLGCQVVDYTVIREIVTAVSYRPDGKGGIVGTLTGNCLFYDIIDGKHIVSTSEDSNVYIWNYNSQEKSLSREKNIQSYESFMSRNVSIAIPWCGIKSGPGTLVSPTSGRDILGSNGKHGHNHHKFLGELDHKMLPTSSDCFSLTRGFLLDSLTRGSATWPEEKLTDSSPVAVSPTKSKSEYKFLKNACHNIFSSPHLWGLVIVTAGWDGRIRTYLNYGLPLRI
ncbi:hypothetical protein GH714_011261 [Hevea brasiliensis]|uniref:Uncharacterized protein n=1 Tax=Hevea brasiliensis TaxID=3981 RepID=A0A6A6MKJ7_HEVBR|nr:hypothetical protein GH714_011261 [Hevea brasiliensis]